MPPVRTILLCIPLLFIVANSNIASSTVDDPTGTFLLQNGTNSSLAMAKDVSLADMFDRALEKEFPDSEQTDGGNSKLLVVLYWKIC